MSHAQNIWRFGRPGVAKSPVLARQHYQRAYEAIRKEALAGSGWAMKRLGDYLSEGKYVERSPKTAAEWYGKAVRVFQKDARHDGYSAMMLGEMYEDGKGVPKSIENAKKMYRQAIELGFDAQWRLDRVSGITGKVKNVIGFFKVKK